MGRLYLFLCLCLGLFGWMASSLPTLTRATAAPGSGEGAGPRAAGVAPLVISGRDSASGEPGTAMASDGSIVLERHDDGHFYADVQVNGTTIAMMVDTGASGVALSRNDARRAGIATSIGMHDAVGEGAGGTVYGDVVEIERIALGPVEARGLPAVVLRGGDTSLLGQQFLRRFARVEIAGDRMILAS